MNETTRTYARIVLVSLIIIGAGWVLAPFIAALLFAAILCLTTWPLFAWLKTRVKDRTTLAALLATLILATTVLVPMAYLTATIADGMTQLIVLLRAWFEAGDWSPPAWLSSIPLAGEHLEAYWRKLAGSQTELANLGKQLFEPTRKLLTSAAALIGQGLLELTLVVFIAFFFYRDGDKLAAHLSRLAEKIGWRSGRTHAATVAQHDHGRDDRHRRHGRRTGAHRIDRLPHRRRPRRPPAQRGDLLPLDGAGRPALDLGRRRLVAL